MASKIQIKRGLQAGIDKLVLSEGEFAVALDTGNVYIGTTAGKTWLNPPGGTADVAVRLQTAREFSISGDATSGAVSFDGSQAVNLVVSLATMAGLTAGSYTKLTVDTKGRVTGAAQLGVSDLPGGIPSSKITGLGTAAALDSGTTAGKVVVVGADGKIADSLVPDLAIGDVFEAENQSAMLALSAQKGDVCIRSDEAKSYILAAAPASTASNWKWLKTPDCKVLSVNGKTGAVTLTAATVGAEPALSTAAAKGSIVDADEVVIGDSAAAKATKKVSLTVLKAALKSYFDTLYNKYVHPAYTAKTAGLYKVTVDATGHVSAATAVAKADITGLGIPGQDTTYAAATTTANGLMLAADKAKLDGVAANANNYVLPAATASVLGGVKVGAGLTAASGVLSVGDIDGGTF